MSTFMSRSGAKFWWKVDLPKEVAYLYKDIQDRNFVPVLFKEINAKKKLKQESNLSYKRRAAYTKPCYVWVFYNNTWLFAGWWIYIKTLNEDYALNFRERREELLIKAMNVFSCGIIPLKENFEQWAVNFSKEYAHKGFKRKKKQGLAKCYCKIDEGGSIVDLFKTI